LENAASRATTGKLLAGLREALGRLRMRRQLTLMQQHPSFVLRVRATTTTGCALSLSACEP